MKDSLQYILLFLLFALLQTLVFEQMPLGPLLCPCVYVLFILLFPFSYNTVYILLWSFVMGLSVDLLGAGVLGLHASAGLCLGFARSYILKLVTTKGEFGKHVRPGLRSLGIGKLLIYVLLSVVLHHSIFFLLEDFSTNNIHTTLLRIVCSTFLNTLLIILMQITFFNQRKSIEF